MSQRNPYTQIDGKIYDVTFQAHFVQATTSIKFPCLLYVLWKTNDNIYNAETNRYNSQAEKVPFNETITLKVPLVYQRSKQSFVKKETQVQLNLISKNRPDQPKLVGRVTIDLANLANNNNYESATQFPLQFCSVNAALTASFKVLQRIQTDTSVHELQRSIGESFSFSSNIKGVHLPSALEKSRDSLSIGLDAPILNSRALEKSLIANEVQSRCGSPKSSHQTINNKQIEQRQAKLLSSSTTQEHKEQPEPKNRTKSFSGIKLSSLIQNNHRRLESGITSENSLNQAQKLRGQIDYLKCESSRQSQQSEKIRRELQGKLKDSQFVKLQLKHKLALLQQANTENNNLRNESARLREEVTRLREEVVAAKIKMAELLDNYNRVSAHLSTSQRQLKRLDIVTEQSNSTNKELISRIQELQRMLHQSEAKCNRLDSEKITLQFALKEHKDLLQTKESTINTLKESNNEQRVFFEQQIALHKQQIKQRQGIIVKYESQLSSMQEEIQRLSAVEHEFQQAKHSWQLTQGISQQQSSRKDERISQLQQTLMTLNERIRQLQGQNQLLADNCRRSREDFARLQEQKTTSLEAAEIKYKECVDSLQAQRANVFRLLGQKSELQTQLGRLNESLEALSTQYSCLSDQYSKLTENNKSLEFSLNQEQQKNRQLEELLLSAHEQKQKQLAQASQKQSQLQLNLRSTQNQLHNSKESLAVLQEKAQMLEEELRGRDDLVARLQEGLSTQIQRTQSLNQKLLSYLQKDERIKDLIVTIEAEERRITQLIIEQELAERKNQAAIKQRQTAITELLRQVEANLIQIAELKLILTSKQNQYSAAIQSSEAQINRLSQNIQQLESKIERYLSKIGQLEIQIAGAERDREEGQLQRFQFQSDAQAQIDRLSAQNAKMEATIADLQNNLCAVNSKVIEKQILIAKEEKISQEAKEELLAKEVQICELGQKIADRQSRLSQLENTISDLQNQMLIKQQLLQEQSKRFADLQVLYQELANDQVTFDITVHKSELKDKVQIIARLESELFSLKSELTKMAGLERTLKIKTIELNSMKFKGKGEVPQTNELLALKDEEIASLQSEIERLMNFQASFLALQQQIVQLRTQLEEIEQQRFNIQSLSNERALMLEEAKQQNRKLMQEITIIGEKHGELEKIIFEMSATQRAQENQKSEGALKAQNLVLKSQLRDYQNLKSTNHELRLSYQRLQQELQSRESLTAGSKQNHTRSNGRQDQNRVYQALKQLLEERARGKIVEKTIQTIDKLLSRENGKAKQIEEKIKLISKSLNKLKIQIAKMASKAHEKQIMAEINNCEQVIAALVINLQ